MQLQVDVFSPRNEAPPDDLLTHLRSCTRVVRVQERDVGGSHQASAVSRVEILYVPGGRAKAQVQASAIPDLGRPSRALIVASEDPKVALHAFQLGAIDFLQLPADGARVETAVERATELLDDVSGRLGGLLQGLLDTVNHDSTSSLVCSVDDKLIFVPLDDVRWIESRRNNARIHTSEKIYCKRVSLSQLEERLPAHFWRLHRSAIVNTHRLERIESTRCATSLAVLDDGTRVEVSRRHRLKQIRPLLD